MLKIVSIRNGQRDILERFTDRTEADHLADKYRLAFGPSFTIVVKETVGQVVDEGIIELRKKA